MKVIGINGSPRKNGNTASMIRTVLAEMEKEGFITEFFQLGGNLVHGCTACRACFDMKNGRCVIEDDPINSLIEKMVEADAILLGSPTYFSNLTPELKALIDRAGYVARANGELFRRKVGAAVVAVRRAGGMHVFNSINHFFFISNMIVPGSSYWNLSVSRDLGDFEKDEEGMQTMKDLADNMAWLLKKIHS
ncbi:MAG: flavodoxin family protein [Synergistales bacterium]|nr:flavodoxin family protein [Synergistales bacterium]